MWKDASKKTRALLVVFLLACVASVSAQAERESVVPTSEGDVVREIAKNGTLGTLLALVLFSYRRDFFKKDEAREAEFERERQQHLDDKARLERLLERNSEILKDVAVQSAIKGEAINRLAAIVERLERSHSE